MGLIAPALCSYGFWQMEPGKRLSVPVPDVFNTLKSRTIFLSSFAQRLIVFWSCRLFRATSLDLCQRDRRWRNLCLALLRAYRPCRVGFPFHLLLPFIYLYRAAENLKRGFLWRILVEHQLNPLRLPLRECQHFCEGYLLYGV